MLFNSYVFIFIFLPLTLALFYGARQVGFLRWSVPILVVASIAFYATSGAFYLALLIGSILFNYVVSALIARTPPRTSRTFLILGILTDLGVLGYFKYYDFFVSNIAGLTGVALPLHHLALPVGISFFTFTQLAYLVDCYKTRSSERDLFNYALFVTLFPHLIAGPIIHHAQMRPQFQGLKAKPIDPAMIGVGVIMFVIGLGKKVLIADNVAGTASLVFNAADAGHAVGAAAAWIGAIAYTLQIYFDFSGYSDMAIGLGLIFGIKLPINFNSPYKSTSIIDFWRRWHITLSTWLRDYVYIALGGNRNGTFNRLRNIFITMLVGGIWHGAGWTFVIWGALHGVFIVVNHVLRTFFPKALPDDNMLSHLLKRAVTLLLVIVAWVFFRAATLPGATSILSGMAFANTAAAAPVAVDAAAYIALVVAAAIALFAPNTQQITGYDENPNAPVALKDGNLLQALKKGRFWLAPSPGAAIFCGVVFAFVLALIWRPAIFIYFNF